MTLKEIEAMDREMLSPCIVAAVLQADPHEIRLQARERPDLLGFPTICIGSRVKIPKEGFLLYCRGLLGNRQPAEKNRIMKGEQTPCRKTTLPFIKKHGKQHI